MRCDFAMTFIQAKFQSNMSHSSLMDGVAAVESAPAQARNETGMPAAESRHQ